MQGDGFNQTMLKFGAPATVLHRYTHWLVLARPAQLTLGSLVLAAREQATAFSALSASAFSELAAVTADIEATLKGRFCYDKLNYLMLMMVDSDVHFHVIPRYAAARRFCGLEFTDSGWPGPPDLAFDNLTQRGHSSNNDHNDDSDDNSEPGGATVLKQLTAELKAAWAR